LSARGNQVPDEASCAAAVALIRQLDSGGEQVAAYQRWLAEVAHLDLKERTERVGMRVRARAVERAMTGRLAVDKLVAAIAETTAQGNARLSPSVTEQHHATREPA